MSTMLHTRRGLEVIVALVVLAGAALSFSLTFGPMRSHAETPAAPVETPADIIAFRDQVLSKPLTVSPGLVQNMLSGKQDKMFGAPLSDYQRAILSDGVITLSEYTAAETAWRTCMVDAGLPMPPLKLDAMGRYNVQYTTPAALFNTMQMARVQCSREYTNQLDLAWADATQALTEKIGEAQRSIVAQCMKANGYDIADVDPNGPADATNSSYSSCVFGAESATGMSGYLGGAPGVSTPAAVQ